MGAETGLASPGPGPWGSPEPVDVVWSFAGRVVGAGDPVTRAVHCEGFELVRAHAASVGESFAVRRFLLWVDASTNRPLERWADAVTAESVPVTPLGWEEEVVAPEEIRSADDGWWVRSIGGGRTESRWFEGDGLWSVLRTEEPLPWVGGGTATLHLRGRRLAGGYRQLPASWRAVVEELRPEFAFAPRPTGATEPVPTSFAARLFRRRPAR